MKRLGVLREGVNVNNTRFNHGYNYILIFIETTSRKVWVFPQRTKSSRETFKSFTLFRIKVNNKISRLLSDADPAFALIKQNCTFFNYCQLVASQGNRTALSRVVCLIKLPEDDYFFF